MHRYLLTAAALVLMAGVVMPVEAQVSNTSLWQRVRGGGAAKPAPAAVPVGQITSLKQANTPEKLQAYRVYVRNKAKADAAADKAQQKSEAAADAAADKAQNAQEQAAMKAQRATCAASMKSATTPEARKTAMDGCRKNEQSARKQLTDAERAAMKQRMAQRKQQRTAR